MIKLCILLNFEELQESEKDVVREAVEEAAIKGAKEVLVRIGKSEAALLPHETESPYSCLPSQWLDVPSSRPF